MKTWLSKNIFAIDKRSSISAGDFNHCASLCPCSDGVLAAWYSGSGECRDDQSVHITYISNSRSLPPIRIGDKTGNPIIWREDQRVWLLWSKFEDIKPIQILAERWRFCSLWIQEVTLSEEIQLHEPKMLAGPTEHLLARTNPIIVGGKTLLPLYDEVRRQCVIYSGKNGEFEEISRYGNHIIQPALWVDDNSHIDGERRIHSLSRNFGNRKKIAAYYFSDSDGESWSHGGYSFFKNVNNSLAVHQWGGKHVVLWNDSESIYRINMTLGTIGWESSVPAPIAIANINPRHGSYPCFCVDDDNLLHFAFTNHSRQIEYHVWNKKQFKRESKRSGNPT